MTLTILALLTLVASSYLSYACFNIVHRMTSETPWTLCFAIVTIAAVGGYGFLQASGYIVQFLPIAFILSDTPQFTPELAVLCGLCAIIMLVFPRVNTHGHH